MPPNVRAPLYVRWLVESDMAWVPDVGRAAGGPAWDTDEFLGTIRNRGVIGLVVELAGKPAGFAVYKRHDDWLDLLFLATGPRHRNRGGGARAGSPGTEGRPGVGPEARFWDGSRGRSWGAEVLPCCGLAGGRGGAGPLRPGRGRVPVREARGPGVEIAFQECCDDRCRGQQRQRAGRLDVRHERGSGRLDGPHLERLTSPVSRCPRPPAGVHLRNHGKVQEKAGRRAEETKKAEAPARSA